MLIRAIERHGQTCLLALDELERLRNPQAVAVLNTLLSQSPDNLRFAMAFRERPPGLDIAMFLLEGRGETITAEDLWFSLPDIARFFDTELSRRELASVAASSAGWPIALRIYRNAAQAGEPLDDPLGGKETVAAWIESRLWRGVPDDDREFVLDVSLFDWILTLTERTEFERAAEWAERVRADLRQHTLYITPHLDFQLGLAAMAQGRTTEAANRYGRALELARVGHLANTGTAMVGEILITELELERSAHTPRRHAPLVSLRLLGEWGTWFDLYAANAAVATELALHDQGVDRGLAVLENATEFARATERVALINFLSALRVSVLTMGDRVEDAARAWRSDDLPLEDEDCVNFKAYRWREVEALAEGRLRLLIAQAEFDAARRFAALASEAINERRLARAHMRMLVLSMRLEVLADDPERAREHLIAYLAAYAESDYLRPLARERGLTMPLLDAVVDSRAAPSIIDPAIEVRKALAAPGKPTMDQSEPVLNPREIEVLQRLESQSDKMIAKDLNLSYDGVRYHVRRIFAKLGARGRFDAVHRARAQGLLPAEGAEDSLNR
ncbi:MAG: LuxR C-terminal-related transcriptional regulator [Gammaproteobacteria bacterium]|nr:LuxR C-terminal-related transcriptional regulator [Gammaproteobacteria bacterium]MDE0440593.1 LuxR C-terminal-related transcriptional regulator [Gammaproteobacteria bacterium]